MNRMLISLLITFFCQTVLCHDTATAEVIVSLDGIEVLGPLNCRSSEPRFDLRNTDGISTRNKTQALRPLAELVREKLTEECRVPPSRFRLFDRFFDSDHSILYSRINHSTKEWITSLSDELFHDPSLGDQFLSFDDHVERGTYAEVLSIDRYEVYRVDDKYLAIRVMVSTDNDPILPILPNACNGPSLPEKLLETIASDPNVTDSFVTNSLDSRRGRSEGPILLVFVDGLDTQVPHPLKKNLNSPLEQVRLMKDLGGTVFVANPCMKNLSGRNSRAEQAERFNILAAGNKVLADNPPLSDADLKELRERFKSANRDLSTVYLEDSYFDNVVLRLPKGEDDRRFLITDDLANGRIMPVDKPGLGLILHHYNHVFAVLYTRKCHAELGFPIVPVERRIVTTYYEDGAYQGESTRAEEVYYLDQELASAAVAGSNMDVILRRRSNSLATGNGSVLFGAGTQGEAKSQTEYIEISWFLDREACDSAALQQVRANLIRLNNDQPPVQFDQAENRKEVVKVAERLNSNAALELYFNAQRVDWSPNVVDYYAEVVERFGAKLPSRYSESVKTGLWIFVDEPALDSPSLITVDYGVGGFGTPFIFNLESALTDIRTDDFALYTATRKILFSQESSLIVQCLYPDGRQEAFWLTHIPAGAEASTLRQRSDKHPLLSVGPPRERC